MMNIPNWNNPDKGNMDEEVIVAVVDTGIDYNHEDLKNVIRHFSPEEQQALGCSEYRYDAVGEEEINSHATHVAGIIGGEWNGFGISGVGSKVKIMDVRYLNSEGQGTFEDALKCYDFIKRALESGIKIRAINNSWGGYSTDLALKALINEVGQLGALTVFAAGNDSLNLERVQENETFNSFNSPYAVVVGSIDQSGKASSYTNYGDSIVDIYAPGGNIISTVPTNSEEYDPAVSDSNSFFLGFEDNSNNISISQVDKEGTKVALNSEVTEKIQKNGRSALAVTLNNDIVQEEQIEDAQAYLYKLEVNFGNANPDGNEISGQKQIAFSYNSILPIALPIDLNIKKLNIKNYQDVTNNDIEVKLKDSDDWGIAKYTLANVPYDDSENKQPRWVISRYKLPENTDYDNLTLRFTFVAKKQIEEIYLDSLGIDDVNKKSSYYHYSGTSMATPAVTGALAVLAGNHPEVTTADGLKDLLLSHVRPIDGLSGAKTNGIPDLSINAAADYSPVINSVSFEGNFITVNGKNFGDVKGTATVKCGNINGDGTEIPYKNVTWSNTEVKIELNSEPSGIYRLNIQSQNGKSRSIAVFCKKTDNVYENDLKILDDYGDTLLYDSANDYEPAGWLEGNNGYLYYMPTFDYFGMNLLYRYDIKNDSWEQLASIPEKVTATQGTIYNNKILISGLGLGKEMPTIYQYDIEKNEWSELNSNNVPFYSTIVNCNGELKLVGGLTITADGQIIGNKIYNYDLETGNITEYMDLTENASLVKAIYGNDTLYVFGLSDEAYIHSEYGPSFYGDSAKMCLQRVKNGKVEVLDNIFSELDLSGMELNGDLLTMNNGNFAYVKDGLVIVGPLSKDGTADTFILKDGENKLTPYGKRLSDGKVFDASITGYNGQLYAIARSYVEPNNSIFRSTAMETINDELSLIDVSLPGIPDTSASISTNENESESTQDDNTIKNEIMQNKALNSRINTMFINTGDNIAICIIALACLIVCTNIIIVRKKISNKN